MLEVIPCKSQMLEDLTQFKMPFMHPEPTETYLWCIETIKDSTRMNKPRIVKYVLMNGWGGLRLIWYASSHDSHNISGK